MYVIGIQVTYHKSPAITGLLLCDNDNKMPKPNRKKYNEFLKSIYWEAVKLMVKSRDGYTCQDCGIKQDLQVHHKTYAHHGDEKNHLDDLITLCHTCHRKAHRGDKRRKPKKKQSRIAK